MDKHSKYTTQIGYFPSIKTNWWLIALRGIFSIIFGIVVLFMPATTVLAITLVFGAYSIVDGICYIIAGISRARKGKAWGSLILLGLLGIITGIVVLITPQIATISLVYFLWTMIAMWAIATGILKIIAAARLRREVEGEWFMAFTGFISILLGIWLTVLLWLNPAASLLTLGLLIGVQSIVSGITSILLAFKLRKLEQIAVLEEISLSVQQ
ncbi:MAG: HdeD family acid-resistance protein [Candidatus Amoebophilus sp.]